ncbi:lactate utilization protein C [Burkholderiaceae bacterium FT117]|uniref:LutC/YkgG family protein n=1 Tax=Zeimonas sediminis TaxID=2944268 RepID=UPI00234305A1|nr:lactate utilization protein C [Zeimonas sediminis]MCM5572153.1 lactate utilization protein C [Zeimonas sediminis]
MDTSKARGAILARIRKAQGRPEAVGALERHEAEAWVASHPVAPQPSIGADTVAHFEAQALRMMCTVERVRAADDAPAAIAAWLRASGLGELAVCWPALGDLPWAQAGLSVEARAPGGDDKVGITGAFAAIAETGTLMLLSGPDTPAATHLLPETHVAIVPASRIVPHYEDGFALMRSERGQPPRAMNLVSGPSRTADIEQTIVLGAHGPYRVHVVIVEEA